MLPQYCWCIQGKSTCWAVGFWFSGWVLFMIVYHILVCYVLCAPVFVLVSGMMVGYPFVLFLSFVEAVFYGSCEEVCGCF